VDNRGGRQPKDGYGSRGDELFGNLITPKSV
jgi:hypothetical protein